MPSVPKDKFCQYCGSGPYRFLMKHVKVCKHPDNTERDPEYLKGLVERGRIGTQNRVWTKDARRNLSLSMKEAVVKSPESFALKNWRHRSVEYNGIKYDSAWEVQFAQTCERLGLRWERNTRSFAYTYRGVRNYFPDFYIKGYRVFVEVKGKQSDRDLCKWRDFTERLLVVTYRSLRAMVKDPSHLRRLLKETRTLDDNRYLVA